MLHKQYPELIQTPKSTARCLLLLLLLLLMLLQLCQEDPVCQPLGLTAIIYRFNPYIHVPIQTAEEDYVAICNHHADNPYCVWPDV